MDSAARLIGVACVSLVIGFLVNDARKYTANEAFAATLVAAGEPVSEQLTTPDVAVDSSGPAAASGSAAEVVAGVETEVVAAPEAAVEAVPVPVLTPRVSYRVKPSGTDQPADELRTTSHEVELTLLQLRKSHAADFEDLPDPTDDGAPLGESGPMPELEYVASLRQDGTSIDQGFGDLEPGTLSRMTWWAGESLYGASIPTPVLVAQGAEPGPTLCVTAAVHGDELNGIETVRQLMYSVDPAKLSGRLIGVPIVNLQGFERHSRYLPDRRDLNRFFPGNPRGSAASRIAYSFFEKVLRHCNALVDLHTGSFHRTNLPQLRANLEVEGVVNLTKGFGSTVILHSRAGSGTLRGAAVIAGIPTVTLEAGEPLRVDAAAVEHSVKALFGLLDNMGMYGRRSFWGNPEPTYYRSLWVRSDNGGILLSQVKLGRRVKAGDQLGTVTDPITNAEQVIRSPSSGRVIGMALNQFVMPGYAAYHIGVEAPTLEGLPSEPDNGHTEMDHPVAAYEDLTDSRDDSEE
ncbi:MAG: succinylglutamate desuccinylase/aspartoacylase family protein [Pseudomonadales bacterium]|nr:succinylglutamate desuccinylase/aspartoacylase family protein [Pseudomonadales bacterium]